MQFLAWYYYIFLTSNAYMQPHTRSFLDIVVLGRTRKEKRKKWCMFYVISIGCKQIEYWMDLWWARPVFSKLCPQPQQSRRCLFKRGWQFRLYVELFSLSQRKKKGITLMSFNSFSQAMGKYNKCFRRRHQWLSHLRVLGECSGFRGSSPIVLTSPFNKPN